MPCLAAGRLAYGAERPLDRVNGQFVATRRDELWVAEWNSPKRPDTTFSPRSSFQTPLG